MDSKAAFYDFLNSHKLAVISTLHANGTPEAAVIGFGQTPQLEIIFGTSNTSRKYKNIMADPHVALVVGWDDNQTVQYEGVAHELKPEELEIVREHYWRKTPSSEVYAKDPTERYFVVTPAWIRHAYVKGEDWHEQVLDLKQ